MTKGVQLHLWILNEKRYYRGLGVVSGETLAEAVAKYGKVAYKQGFTKYRPDGSFGYYEDEKGRRLYASFKKRRP
jgi:hypothetical protein